MARRNTFRLERLLELRTRREQALAGQLGLAEEAARAERAARGTLEALRAAGNDDLLATGRRTVGGLHALQTLVERLDVHAAEQDRRIAVADATVHEARRRLATAFRERRVLDRLKEKHVERVRHDEADHERKEMDEVAVARFLHKRSLDS